MAVYGKTYRPYSGSLTPERRRPLVLTRYGLADLFQSRLFLALFVLCFVPPFLALLRIYLGHNTEAINILQFPQTLIDQLLGVDGLVFYRWLVIPQTVLSFILTAVAAPSLVSPDLRNNAMPLYLGRPLTRLDYMAGKGLALMLLLSAVTWAPGLILVFVQGALGGFGWIGDHASLAPALAAGFLVWSLALTAFGLALSAVVKWRPVARILFVAMPLVASGFATVFNETLGTSLLDVLQFWEVISGLWTGPLGLPVDEEGLSTVGALMTLAALVALSFVVLKRRIRAYEVER